ncbi:hypothetical protein [Kitasatospora camelliae]|uniref:Uncharacterized protein n=1 Tax=Kitasatospora camelliae TaxID=3156397 RepID=A0AAU8K2I8_9ACTN
MITHRDVPPRALAEQGRWAELLGHYRRCRAEGAVEAGPLGHLVAYGAPPELATRLFDADGGPGTAAGVADHDTGPLWEVLATRHTWRRLAPLLEPAPVRRLVAHTRVLLGEELGAGSEPDEEGVPLALETWEEAGWEPAARVRAYLPGGGARRELLALPADREGLAPVELSPAPPAVPGLAATRLLDALAPWARAVCVRGTAPDAAARLIEDHGRAGGDPELPDEPRPTAGFLPFGAVYPVLVQTASAAPALGTAQGRLAVWRLLAAMTGARRPSVPEVTALVERARCFTWCEAEDELCYLHLAVEDPASGLAWAVSGAARV